MSTSANTPAATPCTCVECGAVHPSDWAGWLFVNPARRGVVEGERASHDEPPSRPSRPTRCPCGRIGSVNQGGLCDDCC